MTTLSPINVAPAHTARRARRTAPHNVGLTAPAANTQSQARAAAVAVAAQAVATPVATQTLPAYAQATLGFSAPRGVIIAGAAIVGLLLLGIPGALIGAVAGYLLTR